MMWRTIAVTWITLGLIGGGMRAGVQPWETLSGRDLTGFIIGGVIGGPFILGLKIGQAVHIK